MEDYQYIVKIANKLGIDANHKTIEEIYIDIITELSFIRNRDSYQIQLNEQKDRIINTLITVISDRSDI